MLGDEYTGLYCTCLWMFLCFKIFSKCVFRLIFKKILFPEEVGTIQMSIDCQEGKEITFHFRLIKDIETYSIWWAPQDRSLFSRVFHLPFQVLVFSEFCSSRKGYFVKSWLTIDTLFILYASPFSFVKWEVGLGDFLGGGPPVRVCERIWQLSAKGRHKFSLQKENTVFLFTYVKNWETLVELSSAKFGILWLLVLVILLLVYCTSYLLDFL